MTRIYPCRPRRVYALVILAAVGGASPGAEPVHFARDVVPLLTKLGCNSGACHGSFQGRGGFRLSLLGFDPAADHAALVSEARGRRLFPAAPDRSLLLVKPTGRVAHGGGKRFDVGSAQYRVIRDWIAQGTAGRGDPPTVTRLEVNVPDVVLKPGEARDLRVRAVWSDGVTQDATRLALYETTRDTVAAVDANGRLAGRGPGRAAVTVRYLGQVAAVPVTIPFGPDVPFEFPTANFIDERLAAEWRTLGLRPAPLSSDAEFLRRVSLDLVGTLPTPDEVRTFLADPAAGKRAAAIDRLLDRSEYADYWALKWADLLRAHRRHLGDKGLASFNTWLRSALRENRPVDRVARELLTAQGNLYTSGPVAFYYVDKLPDELAETTAQVFLGVRMQCAKCHHHPFEVWTQDDYYGIAAFFARVRRKDTGENGQFGGAQSMRMDTAGTFPHPATGKPVAPRVLGGAALNPDDPADPRAVLADWLTARDNPFFARNVVNRYWGYLFGRGLVESIDDLRATNPPTFPGLLDALAADFAKHAFDLKHLLRTVCNSRAYQLACEVRPTRDTDAEFVTHRRPRPMAAEVALDAVCAATGVPESFDKMPAGTRAIALPDPAVASYFLDAFGRPKRLTTCECERGGRPDLTQALHLMNGEMLHKKVAADTGRVAALLTAKKADDAVIDELYLVTVSRRPTDAERKAVLARVAAKRFLGAIMLDRRSFLRVGGLSALGLGLPQLLQARDTSGKGRDVNCILLWMGGGPSNIDTFDMKPDAPAEIRGEFQSVATNLTGVRVCEHLPRMAQRMDKVCTLLSVSHPESGDHVAAVHYMQTGYAQRPDPTAQPANSLIYPAFGSVVAREKGWQHALPPYVVLTGKAAPYTGAGYMGSAFNPLAIKADPSDPAFAVQDVTIPPAVGADRTRRRQGMLYAVDAWQRQADRPAGLLGERNRFYQQAYDLVTSPAAKKAFDLSQEPASVRDRYGRHRHGQSALLARRLIEAGVRFVSVETSWWDTHQDNFKDLKGTRLPNLDQFWSALLDDLDQRGLLDNTLVIWMGEFGRTPTVNGQAGRDHWAWANAICMSGAGIRMGSVVGKTDRKCERPVGTTHTTHDFAATVYHLLGIDAKKEYLTPDGRPVLLNYHGTPIAGVLA